MKHNNKDKDQDYGYVNRFESKFTRLFDDFLNDIGFNRHHGSSKFRGSGGSDINWTPAVDIKENEREYLVIADVPGVRRRDIDIEYHDSVLIISGQHSNQDPSNNAQEVNISGKQSNGYHQTKPFQNFINAHVVHIGGKQPDGYPQNQTQSQNYQNSYDPQQQQQQYQQSNDPQKQQYRQSNDPQKQQYQQPYDPQQQHQQSNDPQKQQYRQSNDPQQQQYQQPYDPQQQQYQQSNDPRQQQYQQSQQNQQSSEPQDHHHIKRRNNQQARDDQGDRIHVQERPYGRFSRSIQLPNNIKADDEFHASLENGVLKIRIPKNNERPKKKITIS